MNLFCFTLEGSTESIYEPACSQTFKDVFPKYQCSPALLRRKPEWGGSDPSISSDRPQTATKLKRNSKWSCVLTSPLGDETSEKYINHVCWMSSGDKKDLSHQKKVQNREACKAYCQISKTTRDDRAKELNCGRTQTDLPAQDSETAADTTDSMQATGRLKKLQNLVQTKKGLWIGSAKEKNMPENSDHLPDVLTNNNPVLTCISLGKRAEKPCEGAPSPQEQVKVHEEEDTWSPNVAGYLWSPFERTQPWTPMYHTCQQPRRELWVCGGTLSLPRAAEWDRFESLIQELDNQHTSPSPPQLIRSITDLHLSQNALTRFGRFDAFRQHSPLMKPQDNRHRLQMQEPDGYPVKLQGKQAEAAPQGDGNHIRTSAETHREALTAIINGNVQVNGKIGGRPPFTKEHRQSRNSLESLYSGQSSSSGVTSGSDCSSNRGSLRLEDDVLFSRQFCGRARVHTDHVPSPYDTESLKLKVGDVINIISKPPMGIWTGMLNGKVGNFKFIYVDVLTEEIPETPSQRARHKSTVQEVLKRLSLEEYSSCLQLNGYQTVDDLMSLREHHLVELNVTDPEHRHRLLAAFDSLQQLRSDSRLEKEANQDAETPGENTKADMNVFPRDSSCHMPSDSPDNTTEHTEHHFPSDLALTAEMTAS